VGNGFTVSREPRKGDTNHTNAKLDIHPASIQTMSPIGTQIKSAFIFVHRWMGVFFCLLFALWFASGIVMMYWSYPEITAADRLNHAPVLDPSKIRLSPQEAYAHLQTDEHPIEVRVETFDGRPVYRFAFGLGESTVYADTGEQLDEVTPEMALRIASAWTKQPAASAKVEENTEEDQWTVSGEFQALRPFLKYTWPDGVQVYVSTVTGDVAQYTTHASRMAAYFGAIPHWLYFTPLRKHASNWSRFVIWASGLSTIVALLGIVIGIWMYSPSKRYRAADVPSSVPYVGQKRWHMIFGLVFGPLACTWAFSGMLSMDPFPQLQSGPQGGSTNEIGGRIEKALRGSFPPLSAFATRPPQEALQQVLADFPMKEMDLISFKGEPMYLAMATPVETRVIPMRGNPTPGFDQQAIVELLRKAASPEEITRVRLVTQYESYYIDRHNTLPLPAIFVQLADKEQSAFYIDPKTAQIVAGNNSYSRRNRWFYHGLHSMDFPWLYKYRPAWDILVLMLLIGGSSLSVTALILAWRVASRRLGF
jgi:hypothetical protein